MLAPPDYLVKLRDRLRAREPGRWQWFASQDCAPPSSLCFVPGEAHVVVGEQKGEELAAVIGHQLAHYWLLTWDRGSLRTAQAVLDSLAGRAGAAESALRAQRWTEMFADRGALAVCGDPRPVIAGLGLGEPRARALWRWHESRTDESPPSEALDLFEHQELALHTRALVARVLEPTWFRSETVLAHARAFFPDAQTAQVEALPEGLVAKYLSYVLLDFAVVDEAQGELALAHAFTQAQSVGLAESFERVVRDELKMTRQAFADFKTRIPSLLERAAAQALEGL